MSLFRVTLSAAAIASGCSEPRDPSVGRRLEPLAWSGEQRIVASDSAELDEFGYAVQLAGDRAIAGAYGEDSFRGAAYVFARQGSSWIEEKKLVPSDRSAGDNFGCSVSLTADRAIVGAYGASSYRGAAYVFAGNGTSWTEEQKLVPSTANEYDQFGAAVALADDRALVGAPGTDGARGAVYVFARSGSAWTEEQMLVASDGSAGDDFGYSVALSADRALVGSPGNDNYSGAAHVFARSGNAWREEQKLVVSDRGEFQQVGNSVALSAERALVGAFWRDDLRGAAYVFVRSGSSWVEEQRLAASDGADGDRFGNSLSLSGDRALIGAFAKNTLRGAAYTFVRNGSAWGEEQILVASDGGANDLFAWSVSLAAGSALIGANYTDQLRGKGYLFSLGLANGDPCSDDAECASGFCVDDRCCAADCTGDCAACSIAQGASADGTCTFLPAGSEGNPSCGVLVCNGHSPNCAYCESNEDCSERRYCARDRVCEPSRVEGEACDDPWACPSGFCVDGVCCDAACDGLCAACTAALKGAGEDGRCGPVEAATDPEEECMDDGVATCGANGLCDGSGSCQRYPTRAECAPEPCIRGEHCTSGHCEDGICCDRVCDASERCRAELKVSGGDGTCGPAKAAAPGSTCRFDVQCSSGRCMDGVCCGKVCGPASSPDDGPSCSCRSSAPPRQTPARAWLGLALVLLLRGRRLRGTRLP
jgi:MYXO-CTERM domain-containing protein